MKVQHILLFVLLLLCGCDLGGEEQVLASYGYRGEFGTFIDPRDNSEYKTVVIDEQEWFAENLNYGSSEGYDFYSWEEARTACPEGWHLPTTNEWKRLFQFAEREGSASERLAEVHGFNSFVDLIYFFPAKGPSYRDISCRWKMDDSLLFSVCVLWFYLLWFKGPKQCIHWNLVTGVNSAQRTICALRFLNPNRVISA